MVVDLNCWLCGGDESSWFVNVVFVGVVASLGEMWGWGRAGLISVSICLGFMSMASCLTVASCLETGIECFVASVNAGFGMALMTCDGSWRAFGLFGRIFCTTGDPLTTALITSLAVRSFLACCFLVDLTLPGAAVVASESKIGWAFFSSVFGVCGVSYNLSLRNFLCGGVRPVRLPCLTGSELSPSWNDTRLVDEERVVIELVSETVAILTIWFEDRWSSELSSSWSLS